MSDKDHEGGSSQNLLYGLAFGVVGLSLVLLYLLARRLLDRLTEKNAIPDPNFPSLSFDQLRSLLEAQDPVLPPLAAPAQLRPRRTQTHSYSLVSSGPVRIATAFPDRDTRVLVLPASPGGAAAIVSADLGALNAVDINYPIGNCSVIPVGDTPREFFLSPGEGLFARGTVDGVLVSVTTQGV